MAPQSDINFSTQNCEITRDEEVSPKGSALTGAAIEEVKKLLKAKTREILQNYDLGEYIDESFSIQVDGKKIILGIIREKGTYVLAGLYVDDKGKIVEKKPLEKVKLKHLLRIINEVLPQFAQKVTELKEIYTQKLLIDLKKAIDTLEKL